MKRQGDDGDDERWRIAPLESSKPLKNSQKATTRPRHSINPFAAISTILMPKSDCRNALYWRRMAPVTTATPTSRQNTCNVEMKQLENQLALLGRMLEEENDRKREEIEARHDRELRDLLRAQAKELKEFEIAAQEEKEAKLNEVKANMQGCKVEENIAVDQDDKVEKKSNEKSISCPACNDEFFCSTNDMQRRPCECCDVVDNPSGLCDKCADKMNLKAAICGNWTCTACHVRHVQGCRLCEADEGEGWFMGN